MSTTRALLRLYIGHRSEMLDKVPPNGHTHRWTLFVQSAGPHPFVDRSLITQVVFELHPDFPNRRRVVKDPPFEVTETGYAGFSIPVYISFSGTTKTYKLNYDMNLCLEKQSEHHVEQILEFKQPSKELCDLIMKYGGKKDRKKEKHRAKKCDYRKDKEEPPPAEVRKCESAKVSSKSRGRGSRDERKDQKTKEEVNEVKEEKRKRSVATHEHEAHPSSRSRAKSSRDDKKEPKTAPKESRRLELKKAVVHTQDASPVELSKHKQTQAVEEEQCAPSTSAVPEKVVSRRSDKQIAQVIQEKEKEKPAQQCVVQDKEREKRKRQKSAVVEKPPETKKSKKEPAVEIEALTALQEKLMLQRDASKVVAAVDAILCAVERGTFSNDQHIRPGLPVQLDEETNTFTFDLCSMSAQLIAKLEDICAGNKA